MHIRTRSSSLGALAGCLTLLVLAGDARPAAAQDAPAGDGDAATADGRLPTLTPEDYGQWERLGRVTLSPTGDWVVAAISRVNEEDELRIRPAANPDSLIDVDYATQPTFSADGRWLAYQIGMSEEARERLQERNEPVRSKLGILDLARGETTEVKDVSGFAFSADGAFLAMRRYGPEGDREAEGVDVVVRDLATATDINFGNVSEFAWQDDDTAAPRLAMIIDAEGMAGNGVQLYEPHTGRLSTLDSEAARYGELTWREDADDLALMRTVSPDDDGEEAWADTARVVLAFRGLNGEAGAAGSGSAEAGAAPPEAALLDPSTTAGFPMDHRIVEWEELRWSEDGETLFLGIQERTAQDPCELAEDEEDAGGEGGDEGDEGGEGGDESEGGEDEGEEDEGEEDAEDACADEDDEDPTVEIWHAGDVDIVPTQKVRADFDRRDNHLSAWHLGSGRFVQLENELTETVRLTEGTTVAVGLDQTPYEPDRMFGPVFNDVYVIDVETGDRSRALDRVQYFMGTSPDGRYLLWLEDDQYWTYDTETGARVCITDGLETSFVDLEDDHTVDQKPPFRTAGWLEGDAAILIYDEHDVWRVAPDGSGGARVTRGAEENVRYRWARVDGEFGEAIDPDEPMYFSIYDEWTEMWGYARAERPGELPDRLVWEEARIGGIQKAEEAEVYGFVRQSFEDSPDFFLAEGPELRGARQITRTNPFQDDYAWGRAELLEFENEWGDRLQGSLYYPADYEPGRQYPMIVYIYEIRSSAVRSYEIPSERDYYDFQGWVQDGYFVWQPDIVYRDRDPGVSAVASIVPSVEAVVATGMVDPDRVGLIGHSWGGYQTTFAVTQTDIFAAGVAGAPLTNLFSMYLSVYWNSGGTDARIFEISQGRMEVPFWEDEDAYRRNSPVFHIENMTTPLLMAQGTEDGAVDFNQGVEFYNAARRAGKDFVFLVYNDENHGFRQEENQLDYHRRIDEWFGHYLKGEPAPEWIDTGVPYLKQPGGEASGGGR